MKNAVENTMYIQNCMLFFIFLQVFFGRIVACVCPSVQVIPPIDPKILSHDSGQVSCDST